MKSGHVILFIVSHLIALDSTEQSWNGIRYRRSSIAVNKDFQSDDDDDDECISLDQVTPVTTGKQRPIDINSIDEKEIVTTTPSTSTITKQNDDDDDEEEEEEEDGKADGKEAIFVEVIECASSYSSQFGIETIVGYNNHY